MEEILMIAGGLFIILGCLKPFLEWAREAGSKENAKSKCILWVLPSLCAWHDPRVLDTSIHL